MKRRITFLLFVLISSTQGKSQDTIYVKNNTSPVYCKITKVTSLMVFYTENKIGKSIELKDVTHYSKPVGALATGPSISKESGQKVTNNKEATTGSKRKTLFKPDEDYDHTKFYMSNGISLGVTLGLNMPLTGMQAAYRGDDIKISTYPYYREQRMSFNIKKKIGFRFSFDLGIINRKKYAFQIPIAFNVDRFEVEGLNQQTPITSNNINFGSLEFGLYNYFKIAKKHSILIAPAMYYYFNTELDFEVLEAYSLNIGYGYRVIKPLNISLRYRFNFGVFDYDHAIYIYNEYGSTYFYAGSYHTITLCASYDFLNTRKLKTKKEKKAKVKKDDYDDNYSNMYGTQPTIQVQQAKPAADYSKYSGAELQDALKVATSTSDLDAMLAIQKEIDGRKAQNEFSNMSYVQLEQVLGKALGAEDYKRAELIKKEMAKKDSEKGMPDNKTNPVPQNNNSLESKSIEELQKLKDEAVQKEDYSKAKEIQDILNKKKK